MNHLYEDKKQVLHLCEEDQIIPSNRGTLIVWTLCGIDVPANKSFKTEDGEANCKFCLMGKQA